MQPVLQGEGRSRAGAPTAAVPVVVGEQARRVLPARVEAERLEVRRCGWRGAPTATDQAAARALMAPNGAHPFRGKDTAPRKPQSFRQEPFHLASKVTFANS